MTKYISLESGDGELVQTSSPYRMGYRDIYSTLLWGSQLEWAKKKAKFFTQKSPKQPIFWLQMTKIVFPEDLHLGEWKFFGFPTLLSIIRKQSTSCRIMLANATVKCL